MPLRFYETFRENGRGELCSPVLSGIFGFLSGERILITAREYYHIVTDKIAIWRGRTQFAPTPANCLKIAGGFGKP